MLGEEPSAWVGQREHFFPEKEFTICQTLLRDRQKHSDGQVHVLIGNYLGKSSVST